MSVTEGTVRRGPGRPPAGDERASNRRDELTARQAEARLFTAALRVVAREFVAVAIEAGPSAWQVATRLRDMADRYERRWSDEAVV